MSPLRAALCVLLLSGCGLDFDASTRTWDPRWGAEGRLDVLVPRGEARDRPAVLLLHHGGWNGGDKSTLSVQAQRLARAGFVVGNANYRLAPGVHFPAPVQDAACALAYLRTHAVELKLKPKKVAVLGYSAGANLAETLGLTGQKYGTGDCPQGPTGPPDAVVAGAGPADLLTLPALGDPALAEFIGKTKAEGRALYEAASPTHSVAPGAPPFLLVHGTGDLYVPSGQAVALKAAMEAQGNVVELLLIDGGGHSANPNAEVGGSVFGDLVIDGPEAWPVVLDFLHRTIGQPPP